MTDTQSGERIRPGSMRVPDKGDLRKATSYEYGEDYQHTQARKYRNRMNNHWRHRIQLAHDLTAKYCSPDILGKSPEDTVVADMGCSIGTFAIEFAKRGYLSYGIDFDASALGIAETLAKEENVSPRFICADITNWRGDLPPIDIAACFDIFEHLHDDELGSLLVSIRNMLSPRGRLLFHTCPTQYSYIFFWAPHRSYPLIPLRRFPPTVFNRFVKAYAHFLDIFMVLKRGRSYRDSIVKSYHCNPTTAERLRQVLARAGYDGISVEAANLYTIGKPMTDHFPKQPITFRNLYGTAHLPGSGSAGTGATGPE